MYPDLLDPAHIPLSLYIHIPWCVKNARIVILTRTLYKPVPF